MLQVSDADLQFAGQTAILLKITNSPDKFTNCFTISDHTELVLVLVFRRYNPDVRQTFIVWSLWNNLILKKKTERTETKALSKIVWKTNE